MRSSISVMSLMSMFRSISLGRRLSVTRNECGLNSTLISSAASSGDPLRTSLQDAISNAAENKRRIDFFIEGKETAPNPDPSPIWGKGVVTLVRYRGIVIFNVTFSLFYWLEILSTPFPRAGEGSGVGAILRNFNPNPFN